MVASGVLATGWHVGSALAGGLVEVSAVGAGVDGVHSAVTAEVGSAHLVSGDFVVAVGDVVTSGVCASSWHCGLAVSALAVGVSVEVLVVGAGVGLVHAVVTAVVGAAQVVAEDLVVSVVAVGATRVGASGWKGSLALGVGGVEVLSLLTAVQGVDGVGASVELCAQVVEHVASVGATDATRILTSSGQIGSALAVLGVEELSVLAALDGVESAGASEVRCAQVVQQV